ncbi:MAG: Ig-like domain-containing protein [Spirochaetales bacterium]|uniref:Ig-like domain-containing protein n=1 Tax=Candidatus Thalassospirochaeta sargassi TaxID=3119039 RepID=A0AAJ1IC64_9SPIO|nr:Ig-like domain-containing protein [Spirochaetales bacterium]
MKKTILIIIVFSIIASGSVFAGNKPVSLKSSVPEDGATAVAVDTAIELGFSSNVVNMTVSDNNLGCFSLLNAEGNEVEIDVYLPDDQMEPENKRNITLTPVKPLAPGTEYTLIISGELLAKNGNNLGKDNFVTFTTAE